QSVVVRLRASNQLPDTLGLVTVLGSGLLDLNGFSDTIGTNDSQTALAITSVAVSTGAGTLTVGGNLTMAANVGPSWTADLAPLISGNLNLGGVARQIDVADRTNLPVDGIISANITGSAGFIKTNNGLLLLSGNNTFTGDVYHNAG